MSYSKKPGAYWKAGLLAAILISIIGLAVYYILGAIVPHDTAIMGQEQDRLYAGFIVFSTIVACLAGALVFYFIQKRSARPKLYLGILVVVGLALNTFTAATALHDDYELTAHILHVIVAAAAFLLIPKLVRQA